MDEVLPVQAALELLATGEMRLRGRLADASNTTLLADVTLGELTARCVYKPVRGERPLWDFPEGTLAGREVAAFELSHAVQWEVVPPTVLRDGPLGEGACQLWIDEPDDVSPVVGFVPEGDLPQGWRRVASAADEDGHAYLLAHADHAALSRMALFDAVVNNADRKGGHVLNPGDGHLFGVDHGVSFHVENKLRTVLWGWIGEPVPAAERDRLVRLRALLGGDLGASLCRLVTAAEVAATLRRVDRLLRTNVFPAPHGDWPAVPWPPI
jgi:uncharacterized repeat protein (TIGR03843 family)